MTKKTFCLLGLLLAGVSTVYAMGHPVKKESDDETFNAKAAGTTPNAHILEATSEDKPVTLPAEPKDVEKHAADGYSDPFFHKTERDPDLEIEKK